MPSVRNGEGVDDRIEAGRVSYELELRHGRNAYLVAWRYAEEAKCKGAQDEEAFWRSVYHSTRPRGV